MRVLLLTLGLALFPGIASAQLDQILRGLTGGAPYPYTPAPSYPPGAYPPTPYGRPQPPPYRPSTPPAFNNNPQAVADARRLLSALGYDPGPPGPFDARLSRALMQFQRDRGLQQTGSITQADVSAMGTALRARAAESRPSVTTVSPSFDCARAGSPSERAICQSPQLAQLDLEISDAYSGARAAAGNDEPRLLQEQRLWRTRRDACGSRTACIQEQMQSRLTDLRSSVAAPASEAIVSAVGASIPAAGALSSASAPVIPVADTRAAQRLAMPPAGLRPIHLPTVDGVPLLTDARDRNTDAFLRLLELSYRPDLIEQSAPDDRAKAYAQQFLLPENPYIELGRDWRGADEFERRESRTRFLRDWADTLRHMAPAAPFSFALGNEFDLGSYDPARGGFPPPPQPGLDLGVDGQRVELIGYSGWPKDLLAMDEATGRRVVSALNSKTIGGRRVRLVITLNATALDRENRTMTVRPVRLALWNAAMTTILQEVPIAGPESRPVATDDALARLARPAPGMRPLVLGSVDGVPLLRNQTDLSAVFMLLQAKNAVQSVSDFKTLGLAQTWLSEQAKRELTQSSQWAGADEFDRQRSFDTFRTRYLPVMVQAAPKLPFRFAMATSGQLAQYDTQRAGFPVGGVADLARAVPAMIESGARPLLTSAVPDGFWPIEPTPAQRSLRQVGSNRVVSVVSQYEANEGKAEYAGTVTLRLTSVTLYTPDLGTKLYTYPLIVDQQSAMESTATRLRFDGPVAIDALFECAKAYQASSGRPPGRYNEDCWEGVRARDAGLYEKREGLAGRRAGDADWPFFPRAGAPDRTAAAEAFSRWMLAYAAGIDQAGAQVVHPAGYDDTNRGTFYAFQGPISSGYDAVAKVAGGALQGDQIFSPGQSNGALLGLLPNRASLYALTADPLSYQELRGTAGRVVSTARVGPARLLTISAGARPVLLVELQPVAGTLMFGDRRLASRSFDDVPRLDGARFQAPQGIPVARASRPLLMDGGLLDLIAAGNVGDKLPPEAVVHMVVRRWLHENGTNTVIGDGRGGGTPFASAGAVSDPARFFAVGKRRPTPEEAAELRQPFLDWAKAQTPALPVTVMSPGRVSVKNGLQAMSWSGLACFGAYSIYVDNPDQAPSDCVYRKAHAGGPGGSGWTQEQERECLFRQAATQVSPWVQEVSGSCRPNSGSSNNGIGYADPAKLFMRMSHDLPTPRVPFIGPTRDMLLDATLQITGVNLAPVKPIGTDMLPAPMQSPVQRNNNPVERSVVFDAAFGGVAWRDLSGHEIERLTASDGQSLASVIARFGPSAAPSKPASSPELDLLGIRLGMPFDEAEKLVRASMKVGRVLEGERNFAPGSKLGAIEPLNSGKLFLREDGQEVVALMDEPPAAAGRVMAVWRRIYVDPAAATTDDVLDGLKRKYGSLPNNQQIRTGTPLIWASPGPNCQSYQSTNKRRELLQLWHDDGQGDPHLPTVGFMPGVTRASWGPPWPFAFLEPDGDRSRAAMTCGPYLSVTVDDAKQVRLSTHYFEEMLTDVGQYANAFAESRRALRGAAEPGQGGAPPIKF